MSTDIVEIRCQSCGHFFTRRHDIQRGGAPPSIVAIAADKLLIAIGNGTHIFKRIFRHASKKGVINYEYPNDYHTHQQ